MQICSAVFEWVKIKNSVHKNNFIFQVRGLDASIFQNPHKLHATITTIVLLDEKDIQNAIAILKDCTDDIL